MLKNTAGLLYFIDLVLSNFEKHNFSPLSIVAYIQPTLLYMWHKVIDSPMFICARKKYKQSAECVFESWIISENPLKVLDDILPCKILKKIEQIFETTSTTAHIIENTFFAISKLQAIDFSSIKIIKLCVQPNNNKKKAE